MNRATRVSVPSRSLPKLRSRTVLSPSGFVWGPTTTSGKLTFFSIRSVLPTLLRDMHNWKGRMLAVVYTISCENGLYPTWTKHEQTARTQFPLHSFHHRKPIIPKTENQKPKTNHTLKQLQRQEKALAQDPSRPLNSISINPPFRPSFFEFCFFFPRSIDMMPCRLVWPSVHSFAARSCPFSHRIESALL